MNKRQRLEYVRRLRCAADDIITGRIKPGTPVNVGLSIGRGRWVCVSTSCCTAETAFDLLGEAADVELERSLWDGLGDG
jgi:hypothetical protein